MENKKNIAKVRWYLRYKSPFGFTTLMSSKGVMYFDSFEELAARVAKRVDANPEMQFQFIKETYYVQA